MGKFTKLARIAEIEYSDIVIGTHDLGHKLRVYLIDKSFIDVFFSEKSKIFRFSIHWERKHIDNKIFRLDNTPDKKWRDVSTFPLHFHSGEYDKVVIPPFDTDKKSLEQFVREFLYFVKKII